MLLIPKSNCKLIFKPYSVKIISYLTPREIKQGAFKVHDYDMICHLVTRKKFLLEAQSGFTKDNKNITWGLERLKVPKKKKCLVCIII